MIYLSYILKGLKDMKYIYIFGTKFKMSDFLELLNL